MPSTKPRTSQWPQTILLAMLIAGGLWFWFNHQYAIDFVKIQFYQPSNEIAAIADKAQLNKRGRFMFYAGQPGLYSKAEFNNLCKRQEANSPILGCYNGQQIYLYDVTDKRLDGIEEVTAAHEMLHAAYDRLSDEERARITGLLKQEFKKNNSSDLKERMEYYERNEPGEEINELHSIVGTEFSNIDEKLEKYYAQYFDDRFTLVDLHQRVDKQFSKLSSAAKNLVTEINSLATSIDRRTLGYNEESRRLGRDINNFNNRARAQGGFSTQAEFEQTRGSLQAQVAQLEQNRTLIRSDITRYNQLVEELKLVNNQTSSLYKSLDSTLTAPPKV